MDDNSPNLLKCNKCNDAPGDFLLDSCLHNLCNYCVSTCLEMRDIYNCPKCLTKSKISPNIYLSILNRQSIEMCSWCEVRSEESIATGYCSECDIHLCPECIRGHCRMPQFRSHHVQLKTEADGQAFRNCDSHPNEALEIFCQTCEKLTCRDCQLSLHKEHKHQWIGEKAREMENSLSELKDKLTKRIDEIHGYSSMVDFNKEKLLENVQITRNNLKKYIDEFQKYQENYFNALEAEIENESKLREQKLIDVSKEVTRSLEIIQHCSILLSKIATSREHSLIIQVTPKFLQSIQTIMERLTQEHSTFRSYLNLEYAESYFESPRAPNEILKDICQVKFGNIQKQITKEKENEVELCLYDDLIEDVAQWPIKRELCSVCNDGGLVVCCSGCNNLYHQACHVPRLAQMPATSDWLCSSCNHHSKRFVLESTDRSLPHKGRLNKKERKVVASIFLELLQYHDWTIFLSDESNTTNLKPSVTNSSTGSLNFSTNGSTTQSGLLNSSTMQIQQHQQNIDLDKIRFKIENKIYTSVEKFIEDIRDVFKITAENSKSPSVKFRVTKFEEQLDFLLKKYINNALQT